MCSASPDVCLLFLSYLSYYQQLTANLSDFHEIP